MQEGTDRRFSDEEASRIWRRAAELQTARLLPVPSERTGGDETEDDVERHQLSREEVLAIAGEAGIEPEFVRRALTEAELALLPPAGATPLQSRRQIDAPPPTVQAALQEVAAREPFRLRLVDIRSADEARLMVFDVLANWGGTLNAGSLAAASNAVALHALLRSGSAPDSTELVLYGVPNPELPRSVRKHDVIFGGVGALVGGGLGVAGAVDLALTGAVLLGPVAFGALTLGAAGVGIMRSAQGWARRKDAESLEQLADEVAGAVRIRRHSAQSEPGDES